MTLNHLNLPVENVADAVTFFETYFSFRCVESKGDNLIAVLHGMDGFVLVLMSFAISKSGSTEYPEAFHIGFMQHEKEAVTVLYEKLKAGGIEIGRAPAKIRNSFGFYFHYAGIMLEVACYI